MGIWSFLWHRGQKYPLKLLFHNPIILQWSSGIFYSQWRKAMQLKIELNVLNTFPNKGNSEISPAYVIPFDITSADVLQIDFSRFSYILAGAPLKPTQWTQIEELYISTHSAHFLKYLMFFSHFPLIRLTLGLLTNLAIVNTIKVALLKRRETSVIRFLFI